MARLWIFDGMTEELATTASNDPNASTMRFFDAPYREMLNDEITFEFAVNGAHEDAVHVVENNIVAFTDNEGDLQAFRIVEIEEVHESDGAITKYAHCEHMAYEMLHDIVEDRRIVDGELDVALSAALSASRWEVGRTDSLGVATINFYYANGLNNVRNVAAAYGGEVKFRVEATGGKLTGFYVDVLARRGADTGKRFTYTKDITEIRRIVDTTGIKTALYGRGASEEIEETGGHTRKPHFGDVVWSVSDGDPVDKPAGQKWVGDDDARNMYGFNGGQRHRFGVVEFDTTDTAELLALTWQRLQELKTPRATYEMSVLRLETVAGLSHESVNIGDTVFVIDRDLGIRAEARVVELEIDEANPTEGTVILGNFIPLFTDYDAELEAVKRTVQDKEAIWDEGGDPPEREVDDEDFPDTKPPTPENVRAEGLFRLISVEWDYDPATYIAAYEVFASQVPDFTPDGSNRVYRGKVGGYVHNADVNQTWYFRVRAINTHGTPSDLSEEVSATTLRVQENDIEEEYRQGIVDEAKGYTDAERDAILADMADKADLSYVDGRLETKADADVVDDIISDVADKADLTYVNSQLQTKADAEDTYTKIEVDNALNGYVSVTEYETDQEGIVTQLSDHESRIEQTETDIEARVTRTEYNQKIGDIEGDITSIETTVSEHGTAISQNADDIELKANAEDVYTKQQVDSSLGDKADKSEVNAIETRVESAEATLSVHADRIDSKVEQVVYDADMDGVITRLDTAESNISQQADEIELRVTKQEFEQGVEEAINEAGDALYFDESNYIRTTSMSHEFEEYLSFEAWVYWEGTDTADLSGIAAFAGFTSHFEINGNGRLRLRLQGLDTNYTSIIIPKNSWVHLAFSYENSTDEVKIYLNGEEVYTHSEDTGRATLGVSGLYIGTSSSGSRNFHGAIRDVRLWDKKLDVETIKENMYRKLSGQETGLVLYYPLAGTGDSIIDKTPNEFHAYDVGGIIRSDSLSMAQSTITQQADEIEARVEKDGVISAINLTSEEAKIDAQRITLEGDVYMEGGLVRIGGAVIDDVHIKDRAITSELIADDVITDRMIASNAQIDFAKIANVEITNAQIASVSADKITGGSFEGETFTGGSFNGSRFEQSDSNSRLVIEGGEITTYANDERTSKLNEKGQYFYRNGKYAGVIGTSSFVNRPDYIGLAFNMTSETSYMTWAHADVGDDSFITKLTWHKDDSVSTKGFVFSDDAEFRYPTVFRNMVKLNGYIHVQSRDGDDKQLARIYGAYYASDSYRGLTIDLQKDTDFFYIDDTEGLRPFEWHRRDKGYSNRRGFQFNDPVTINTNEVLYLRRLSTTNYNSGNRHMTLENYTWNGYTGVAFTRGTDAQGAKVFLAQTIGALINKGNAYIQVGEDSIGNYVKSVDIYNRTYSYSSNVYVTSNGTLGRSTSATKYKVNIDEMDATISDRILDLAPKTWYDKTTCEQLAEKLDCEYKGEEFPEDEDIPRLKKHYGLIAEDLVEVGLEQFVEYGDDGKEVEGIEYDRLWTLLIPIVRDHKETIEKLQSRIETLEEALAGK